MTTPGTLATVTPLRPPRLVATDLDGTIVRGDRTVSARTVAALARVERAGGHVVLVTGRPPRLMGEIAAAFGHRGVAICSNGAFAYDMRTRTVVAERPIPVDVLGETARLLREVAPGIGLAVEYAQELAGDAHYEAGDWDADTTVRRLDDAVLFARPAPKLLGRHPELSADDLLELVRPAIGELVTVTHSNGVRLVEAVARGVSKAAALGELAQRYGIPRERAIAFGDMPNDLPMMAWAGTSYGVANAHPEVLASVDHVIASNDEDGVAAVLEGLFPEG
ncbi:hydrolase [Kitasatospora xanthocidica]|uniref:HAD family hydrolase n=1 Tax=Kitasatospora xanthocidica TaxID=83382 RepID=UPI0016781327|nr:HAD family hydrolase [Kitasatospora xanthocidica]GHF63963.1 hydrolase [Kitasatospora xanthocidica]